MESTQVITSNLRQALVPLLNGRSGGDVFILTDNNADCHCLPLILDAIPELSEAHRIIIPSGDFHKTLDSAVIIWRYLSEHGATRHTLMLNVGGGVITDLGGFVAATFKRGMPFINLPTTLLGAVDAATGDKTGINFLGLKNEIGLFAPAENIIIYLPFFKTLDSENILSGYAEMVKHALIYDKKVVSDLLRHKPQDIISENFKLLFEDSLRIKKSFIASDKYELGRRKALNFGHTFGHAFEMLSYQIDRPILHGVAVMWGLVCETLLSHIRFNFPKEDVLRLLYFAKENYRLLPFSCKHYDALYALMKHDKKNIGTEINFTLLKEIGDVQIDQTASQEEVFECLDFIL